MLNVTMGGFEKRMYLIKTKRLFWAMSLVAITGACTSGASSVEESVHSGKKNNWNLPPPPPPRKATTSASEPTKTGATPVTGVPAVVTPPVNPTTPDPCKLYPKMTSEPPFYIADSGVMLTRIVKACVTREGERGFEESTPFIVMGFPCTGGGGKIDIKGNYYNPKMVAFIIATSCPMVPANGDAVKKAVLQATGLSDKAMLMAHNPLAVQYWEIPSMSEGDVGFSVELRSERALDTLWKRMRDKSEPIGVRIYGRENAWVQGNHFYQVEGELRLVSRTGFQLHVTSAKSLTATEIQDVKTRCEALRPRRNCISSF